MEFVKGEKNCQGSLQITFSKLDGWRVLSYYLNLPAQDANDASVGKFYVHYDSNSALHIVQFLKMFFSFMESHFFLGHTDFQQNYFINYDSTYLFQK